MKVKKETHSNDRAVSSVAESESSSLALQGWKKAEGAPTWTGTGPAERGRCLGRPTGAAGSDWLSENFGMPGVWLPAQLIPSGGKK